MRNGFKDSGIKGDYYPTSDLSGGIGFTVYDFRLDFFMPSGNRPAYTTSTGMVEVPADGWSVRWVGPALFEFTETCNSFISCLRQNCGVGVL